MAGMFTTLGLEIELWERTRLMTKLFQIMVIHIKFSKTLKDKVLFKDKIEKIN